MKTLGVFLVGALIGSGTAVYIEKSGIALLNLGVSEAPIVRLSQLQRGALTVELTSQASKIENEQLEKEKIAKRKRIAKKRGDGKAQISRIGFETSMCTALNDSRMEAVILKYQLNEDATAEAAEMYDKRDNCKEAVRLMFKSLTSDMIPEVENEARAYYASFVAYLDNPRSMAHQFQMQSKSGELDAKVSFLKQ